MRLNCSTSFFNTQHEFFALKLCMPSSGNNNTDSATRSQCVQSLVTYGITDKAAYLSKATE